MYQGAFPNGVESSNHLMVGFDEINSTWDNLLGELWNNPDARAEDILPGVEEALNKVLARIAEEQGYSFE